MLHFSKLVVRCLHEIPLLFAVPAGRVDRRDVRDGGEPRRTGDLPDPQLKLAREIESPVKRARRHVAGVRRARGRDGSRELTPLPGVKIAAPSHARPGDAASEGRRSDRGAIFLRADRIDGEANESVEASGKVELRSRRETVLADWLQYDLIEDEI